MCIVFAQQTCEFVTTVLPTRWLAFVLASIVWTFTLCVALLTRSSHHCTFVHHSLCRRIGSNNLCQLECLQQLTLSLMGDFCVLAKWSAAAMKVALCSARKGLWAQIAHLKAFAQKIPYIAEIQVSRLIHSLTLLLPLSAYRFPSTIAKWKHRRQWRTSFSVQHNLNSFKMKKSAAANERCPQNRNKQFRFRVDVWQQFIYHAADSYPFSFVENASTTWTFHWPWH